MTIGRPFIMNSLVRFSWLLPLFCLSSCVKENFEDVQIEVEFPEPPVVLVVDCETMGLNVGDPCVVSSGNPDVNEQFDYYHQHPEEVHLALAKGAEKARKVASEVLLRVRDKIGY